jgi:hypothetical protein
MKKILIIYFLLSSLISFGQFYIKKPLNWYDNSSNEQLYENIVNVILNEKKSNILINDVELKKGKIIKAFSKYDVAKSKGLSPSITVTVVKNVYHYNISTLRKNSENNLINELKKYAQNVILKKSEKLVLDGKQGFFIHSTFKLPNFSQNIRSWVYFFFLTDDYFIQISFSDFDNDNCEIIYKKVLNSIKF